MWLMTKARKLDPRTQWGEIIVILTNDKQIATVNEQVFLKTDTTDVIALRYDPLPEIEEETSAELFINVERAFQCRQRSNWNYSTELALYLAHGCDHLAGATDYTNSEQKQMRRRELRWLREASAQGLTSHLFIETA